MNSSQGIKGFTTFLILVSILGVGAYFLNNTYKSAVKEIKGLFEEDESKSKVAGKSTNATKNYEGFGSTSNKPLADSSGFSNTKHKSSDGITASGFSGTGSVMGKSTTKSNPDPLFLGLIQGKENAESDTFNLNADNFTGIVTMEAILDNKMNEMIVAEFKDALIFEDLRYDFDGDKKVTSKDYPLFIEFILNSED